MSAERRQAVIDAHRHVASLLEDNDDLPAPFVSGSSGAITWALYSWDCPLGIPATVALIRRTIGGKWDKTESNEYGSAEMVFAHDNYSIKVKREAVCVRRVVGTETVIVPATDAVKAQPARSEKREIVEWDCTPVLAAEGVAS